LTAKKNDGSQGEVHGSGNKVLQRGARGGGAVGNDGNGVKKSKGSTGRMVQIPSQGALELQIFPRGRGNVNVGRLKEKKVKVKK